MPNTSVRHLLLSIVTWFTSQLTTVILIILLTLGSAVFINPIRSWLIESTLSIIGQTVFFSKNELNLSFNGVRSDSFNHIFIENFSIFKQEKLWIHGKNLDLSLNWKFLWLNKFDIRNLSIQELHYNHQEHLPSNEAQSKSDAQAPTTIPDIHLHKLSINKLSLRNLYTFPNENGLSTDEEMLYSILGDGKILSKDESFLKLKATALKQKQPSLEVAVNQTNSSEFEALVSVNEPPGGYLGSLLHLPNNSPLELQADLLLQQQTQQTRLLLEQLLIPLANSTVVTKGDFALIHPTDNTNVDIQQSWMLEAHKGTVEIDHQISTFTGTLTPDALIADVELNKLPAALLTPWLPKIDNGQISGILTLDGPPSNLMIKAEIESDIQYDEKPLSVSTRASLDNGLLFLDRFFIEYDLASLMANGVIDRTGTKNDLSLELTNITTRHIHSFDIDVPDGLSLTTHSAIGRLSGKLNEPKIDLNVDGSGTYKEKPLQFNSKLHSKNNTLFIDEAIVNFSESQSTVSGQYDWGSQDAIFDISISDLPLDIVGLFGVTLPESVSGFISSKITTQGLLTNPNVKIEAVLSAKHKSTPIRIHTVANKAGERIEFIQIEAEIDSQKTLLASGFIDTDGYNLQAQVIDFPTDLTQAFALILPTGLINSNITAAGTLHSPDIRGTASYIFSINDEVDSNLNTESVTLETDLDTKDGYLSIIGKLKQREETTDNIELTLAVDQYMEYFFRENPADTPPLPLHFNLKSELDTKWLSLIIDREVHQLSGRINTNLSINGDIVTPNLNGFISLQEIDYFNSLSGTNISNVNCLLSSKIQTITINNCVATDGHKGTFEILGSITLPNKTDGLVDISLNLDQANVINRSDINSQTSGEISLTGDFNKVLAAGQLEVSPLEAIVDVNVGSSPPEIVYSEVHAQEELNRGSEQPQFTLPTIEFDIDILVSNQAYLRGRGLEAELGGQFRLGGNSDVPDFAGDLSIIRGELELFGRKFNLTQGQMIIIDDSASISATGVYNKHDKQISANIEGSDNELSIQFSSIPALPEDEILSYIIFGESAANIEPIKAIQLALAIQKLKGGQSSFDLIGSARDLLDVDSITLDNYTSEENGESGLSVGVGKYLNEKTYLEIERTPNPSQPWKGTINIEVTPRVLIQSTTGGSSGIDSAEIIWQKDY